MAVDYMQSAKKDGLTLVLYRGEDMVLLAFDIDDSLKKPDFAGFGIQYRIGDKPDVFEVYNFLTFKAVRPQVDALNQQIEAAASEDAKKPLRDKLFALIRSVRSPLQMFRWAHVPSRPIDGKVTYIVSAMFANDAPPSHKASSAARHPAVVTCCPVPNAKPASISKLMRSGSGL